MNTFLIGMLVALLSIPLLITGFFLVVGFTAAFLEDEME